MPSSQTLSMTRVTIVALALLGVLASACGSDGDGADPNVETSSDTAVSDDESLPPDITLEFLDGEWYGDECNCTIAFEDGTYEVTVLHLNRELRTVDQGEVSLADGLMTFVSGSESEDCQAGEAWVARYSPLRSSDAGADRIQLSPVSEDCDDRGRGGLGWYEQLTRRP